MMVKENTSVRLRDMKPNRAWAHCIVISKAEIERLNHNDQNDLMAVFRSYILNGYDDANISVPARIKAVWGRCKAIIDKEAER